MDGFPCNKMKKRIVPKTGFLGKILKGVLEDDDKRRREEKMWEGRERVGAKIGFTSF